MAIGLHLALRADLEFYEHLSSLRLGFVTTGWPFPRGGQFPVGDLSACCFPHSHHKV